MGKIFKLIISRIFMTITVTDLHAHVTNHYDIIGNPKIPLISKKDYRGFFNNPKNPTAQLLDHCFATAPRTLVGIINFDDNRGQMMFDEIRNSRSDYDQIRDHGVFMVVQRDDKQAGLLIGDEIQTDKGHIVIMAAEKNGELQRPNTRKLLEVLKFGREYRGFIYVDHVLAEFGWIGAKINKFMNGHDRLSLREEEIVEFKDYLDAIGIHDSNFGLRLGLKQAEIASKYKIPRIVTSDSHRIRDIFSSSMALENLDYSGSQPVKNSLREGIKPSNNSRYIRGETGILEALRDPISGIIATVGLKTGILTREQSK